ncbi:MAG: ABC transporter ATP-binding protein [Bifidobacteriaceae bacterium]|jgi:ABC-type nitrate/sulfonate/bicarbonate transport system ATPase subunit|nr:ABC transporter ATP-binding protein [Bifidobacteriaceae bacterium]
MTVGVEVHATGTIPVASAAQPPRFELWHISKGFETPGGFRPVLDGIDLKATSGSFISIIGPSGCGKSTLFNVMAGLEPADAGRVYVDGQEAGGKREHFGYMPQKDLLFPWRTILDNTTIGLEVQGKPRKEARVAAAKLFEPFGLAGFEHARPFELSGGMRQRAALLRTVVQEREILLLDEPFGALDSLTRLEMQTWLAEVWVKYRWTVVMVTHDVREAVYLSDQVVVLSARPTKVRLVKDITLPRPREEALMATPEFAAIERELLEVLHEESRHALQTQRVTV